MTDSPRKAMHAAACIVCMEHEAPLFAHLCARCARSYRSVDINQASVIAWAAKRAVRFERARREREEG